MLHSSTQEHFDPISGIAFNWKDKIQITAESFHPTEKLKVLSVVYREVQGRMPFSNQNIQSKLIHFHQKSDKDYLDKGAVGIAYYALLKIHAEMGRFVHELRVKCI